MDTLGTVRHIARYPVKSMAGEELESVAVRFQGLPGDRSYAFVQEGLYSPFPFLTAREYPGLLGYSPQWDRSTKPPRLNIVTDQGATLPIEGAELRNQIESGAGRSVRLHSDHRGNHDIAYVSVITTATISELARAAGVPPDHRRFRMNFVVESDLLPFAEKQWVGKTLRIGDLRLAITEQDRRCLMITRDPDGAESAPAVLKAAGELNEAFAGVYASVLATGTVTKGDAVQLEN